jgi:hypothetical protein
MVDNFDETKLVFLSQIPEMTNEEKVWLEKYFNPLFGYFDPSDGKLVIKVNV